MSRFLRLFGLRAIGEPPMPDVHFMNRSTAEKARERANDTLTKEYVVCVGPDHRRYPNLLAQIEKEKADAQKNRVVS